jgi:ectoine hydroxylase-related dioxygenase (phytanoyl-CoA dioxygenase family)
MKSPEARRLSFSKRLAREGVVEVAEPYAAGDVSFHLGWTLHRAGPNTTTLPRKVHTVIYMDRNGSRWIAMDRNMRLAEPRNAKQENDHRAWTPSTKVGEIMADPLNPVLCER